MARRAHPPPSITPQTPQEPTAEVTPQTPQADVVGVSPVLRKTSQNLLLRRKTNAPMYCGREVRNDALDRGLFIRSCSLAATSLLGVVFNVINLSDPDYNLHGQNVTSVSDFQNDNQRWVFASQIAVVVLTFVSILQIMENYRFCWVPHGWLKMAAEILVHLPIGIPFYTFKTYSKWLSLLMFVRVYVLARPVVQLHPAYTERFNIFNQPQLRKRYPCIHIGTMRVAKIMFITRTGYVFLFLCVFLISVVAFGGHIAEREEQPTTFGNYWNCVWWAYITATTIGYGDMFPVTHLGRTCTAIGGIFGIVLANMVAGVLATKFALGNAEQEIVRHIEKMGASAAFEDAAVRLLQNIWRYQRLMRVHRRARRMSYSYVQYQALHDRDETKDRAKLVLAAFARFKRAYLVLKMSGGDSSTDNSEWVEARDLANKIEHDIKQLRHTAAVITQWVAVMQRKREKFYRRFNVAKDTTLQNLAYSEDAAVELNDVAAGTQANVQGTSGSLQQFRDRGGKVVPLPPYLLRKGAGGDTAWKVQLQRVEEAVHGAVAEQNRVEAVLRQVLLGKAKPARRTEPKA